MADRVYNQAQEQEDIAEYLAGASMEALARKRGCNVASVRRMLRRNNVLTRKRGVRIEDLPDGVQTEILKDREFDMSQAAIARKHGVSQAAVSRYFRSLGHPQWKRPRRSETGRWQDRAGYVWVMLPADSPYASMAHSAGSVMEHRLLMAQSLGRPLLPGESVHHIDGDRSNNDLANLELWRGPHGKGVRFRCRRCGSTDIEVY